MKNSSLRVRLAPALVILVLAPLFCLPESAQAAGRGRIPDFPEECAPSTGGLVQIHRLRSEDPRVIEKASRAAALMERVLTSSEFKRRVIGFEWAGRREFVQSGGLSNEEVLERIERAEELSEDYLGGLRCVPNYRERVIDLEIDLFWPWPRRFAVVGSTNPSTPWISTNGNHLMRMSEGELAGHWVHEWLHKIGFEHDYDRTARRPYSVPYGVGTIVEEIAEDFSEL